MLQFEFPGAMGVAECVPLATNPLRRAISRPAAATEGDDTVLEAAWAAVSGRAQGSSGGDHDARASSSSRRSGALQPSRPQRIAPVAQLWPAPRPGCRPSPVALDVPVLLPPLPVGFPVGLAVVAPSPPPRRRAGSASRRAASVVFLNSQHQLFQQRLVWRGAAASGNQRDRVVMQPDMLYVDLRGVANSLCWCASFPIVIIGGSATVSFLQGPGWYLLRTRWGGREATCLARFQREWSPPPRRGGRSVFCGARRSGLAAVRDECG